MKTWRQTLTNDNVRQNCKDACVVQAEIKILAKLNQPKQGIMNTFNKTTS